MEGLSELTTKVDELTSKVEGLSELTTKVDELTTKVDELREHLSGLLTELNERTQNIEAKIEAPAKAPKKAAAVEKDSDASPKRGFCSYVKTAGVRKGEACGKTTKNGSEFCGDHPNGMTRGQYKKLVENGEDPSEKKETKEPKGKLAMHPHEDDDDLEVIEKPDVIAGIVITKDKPYQAFFQQDNNKARKLDKTQIANLEKFKIIMASDKAIKDTAKSLNLELETDKKTPAKPAVTAKGKKAPVKEESDDEDEEEEDDEEVIKKTSKVKGLLNKSKETEKAKAKDAVKPVRPIVSLRKDKKEEKKEEKEDDDEDDDE